MNCSPTYSLTERDGMVIVCGWSPDKKSLDKAAKLLLLIRGVRGDLNMLISHGICPAHLKQLEEMEET